MNGFCTNLTERPINRFKIDAKVFVSKKKKHIHLPLTKPLFEHHDYKQIISFISKYFEDRIMFCEPYVLNFSKLNQSIKWRHVNILVIKKVSRLILQTLCWTDFLKRSKEMLKKTLSNIM